MRTHRCVAGSVVLSLLLGLSACGGGGREAQPAPAPLPDSALAGLPGWEALPEPTKQLSLIGPGWAAIAPQETVATGNAALGPGKSLTLNAATGMAYAIYGIAGFDGDNGPTSARITQSPLTGQYFVGFSDYVAGIWRFAGPFTGSAQVEIPLPDDCSSSDYLNPRAFTSPGGTCYFVVAVATGGIMTITDVQLGVQGGVRGPEWTAIDSCGGGPAGCLVHWRPSASCKDPDFAGYLLERAPLLSGDFAPLFAEPLLADYYIDTTGDLDQQYRYRLAAVDASGNLSLWFTTNGGRTSGGLTLPVPVLHLPRGPLNAPAEVTFDLSDSFDPEGIGISEYRVEFLLYPRQSIVGANPVPSAILPPGCHVITAWVRTTDGREQSTSGLLKVYPQWGAVPGQVASACPSTMAWLRDARGLLRPGDSYPVLFGYDPSAYSAAFWAPSSSGVYKPHLLPLYQPLSNTAEPVLSNGALLVPCAFGGAFALASLEGSQARWILPQVAVEYGVAIAAAAGPAGEVYLYVMQDNAGVYDLTQFDMHGIGLETIVVSGVTNVATIAAEYNIASGMVDIVYSTGVGTYWVRWDPQAQVIVDSLPLYPGPSSDIDIETNTTSGEPGVLFYDQLVNLWVYRERDPGGVWQPAEWVDNGQPNHVPGDLAFCSAGEPHAYISVAAGQSVLYRRTAPATWVPRNTPFYAATAGEDMVLLPEPGGNSFLAGDRTAGGQFLLARLTATPEEILLGSWNPREGLINNIQGTAGTADATPNGNEELHVMFSDRSAGNGYHYTSLDHGATWGPKPVTALRDFDLGATSDGAVYATNYTPANHELLCWDFVPDVFNCYSVAPTAGAHYSFLRSGILNDFVVWATYDGVGQLRYTAGQFGSPPTVVNVTAEYTPVWAGAADAAGYSTILGLLANGSAMDEAQLFWTTAGNGAMNLASDSLLAEVLRAYSLPAIRNKQLAASSYYTTHTGGGIPTYELALWTGYGALTDAQRYTISVANGTTTQDLSLPYEWLTQDARRSVTAGAAAGLTGVALISSFDGSSHYLEWSNFGAWEQLPVPGVLKNMRNPELIIGRDGRWHIVYYDWGNDRVLCLNSL